MGTMKEVCETMFDVRAEVDENVMSWETVEILAEDIYCCSSDISFSAKKRLSPADVAGWERLTLQLNGLLCLIRKYEDNARNTLNKASAVLQNKEVSEIVFRE